MKFITTTLLLLLLSYSSILLAQLEKSVEGNVDNLPVREYELTIDEMKVNITGKFVKGMAVNGSVPGPTLFFKEGEYAKIHVTNNMKKESSVHWHGLLLPNFYDGVPYLTTPPIEPGETFTYEFPLKQSGTYWYHSHSMLQEQSGVYGSIVIHPKEKKLEYDHDLVMVLSDWTNTKPMNILRNLKRGNEWFSIAKGTATPLNQVIARGGLGAQIKFWGQRMEGADIADVYYNAFLINGQQEQQYPNFKAGEKVRVRFINAAASTYFWLTFGGEVPYLVASDGIDVVPVKRNKTIIAVAETYDFIVTIRENQKLEIRASAQDGSGSASAFLGQGETFSAMKVARPDKIDMMKKMAKMKMTMGAPALKFNSKKDARYKLKKKFGMQMDQNKKGMNMHKMEMSSDSSMQMNPPKDSSRANIQAKKHDMPGMDLYAEFNYDYLKSPEPTNYDTNGKVREILLNLTGNMSRYVWSINGVPISETDKIKIKEDEVTRITFNNLTMMHHPMHLHGHFFRLLNKNGTHSPLKHTVNVPPMQSVTIEFYGNEYGDWFMHCHILYHMMSGMARVISYDTPRDERLEGAPLSKLIHETNMFYFWGTAEVASHMAGVNLLASNTRNEFNLTAEFGYNKNLEAEFTYNRYLSDFVRIFAGANLENESPNSLNQMSVTAIAGLKYFTPYMFDLEISIDNQLRPQIRLERAIMIFPRLSIFGRIEYRADFEILEDKKTGFKGELVWAAGLEYMLSKNFSLMGSYDNRFGFGGGLSMRF
jgi:hypothetical protein